MAPDHESRRGVVRGVMQQAPPKSFKHSRGHASNVCSQPLNAGFVGVTHGRARDGGGRGRHMSPRIAGGYRQGRGSGGNGGRTPMENS